MHPRIQLLTIEDLLGRKSIDYPQATDVTFKKAQRVRPNVRRTRNPSDRKRIYDSDDPLRSNPAKDAAFAVSDEKNLPRPEDVIGSTT